MFQNWHPIRLFYIGHFISSKEPLLLNYFSTFYICLVIFSLIMTFCVLQDLTTPLGTFIHCIYVPVCCMIYYIDLWTSEEDPQGWNVLGPWVLDSYISVWPGILCIFTYILCVFLIKTCYFYNFIVLFNLFGFQVVFGWIFV